MLLSYDARLRRFTARFSSLHKAPFSVERADVESSCLRNPSNARTGVFMCVVYLVALKCSLALSELLNCEPPPSPCRLVTA